MEGREERHVCAVSAFNPTLVNNCQRQLHQEEERDVEVGAEIKDPPTRLALKCRPSIVCHDQHVKIVSHHTQ